MFLIRSAWLEKFCPRYPGLVALAFVTLFAGISISTASMVSAKIAKRDDGERKINLSGRQRMLTQFMAKATCFGALGKQVDRNKNWMTATHWLFDSTLTNLSKGNKTQGLLPETHGDVRRKLAEVEALWAKFGPAVLAAHASDLKDAGSIQKVYALNVPVLVTMNEAVSEIEKAYSQAGTVDKGIAAALNISGRQRMLTQRASKEFCLIAAGYEVEESRRLLGKTVSLFNSSMRDLLSGNEEAGIPPPPVGSIGDQLERVRKLWVPLSEVFEKVAAGEVPREADIELISENNETVLREMNKAVWLYETVQ